MPYNEIELQQKFIRWYKSTHDYREVAADEQASSGACMDSVGFVDKIPVLIEFKDKIDLTETRPFDIYGSAMERKIARGLRCLHGDREEPITGPLQEWNRKATPHIYIVANRLSIDGQKALEHMLEVRSREWWFSYTVDAWRGDLPVTIVSHVVHSPELEAGLKPAIPDIPSPPSTPRHPRSRNEFETLANERGVRELFDAMIQHATSLGGKGTRHVANYNFSFPRSGSTASVVGMWFTDEASDKGLIVNYSLADIERCFGVPPNVEDALPGESTYRRGHLGRSRYLKTVDDVIEFWRLIAGNAPQSTS